MNGVIAGYKNFTAWVVGVTFKDNGLPLFLRGGAGLHVDGFCHVGKLTAVPEQARPSHSSYAAASTAASVVPTRLNAAHAVAVLQTAITNVLAAMADSALEAAPPLMAIVAGAELRNS